MEIIVAALPHLPVRFAEMIVNLDRNSAGDLIMNFNAAIIRCA